MGKQNTSSKGLKGWETDVVRPLTDLSLIFTVNEEKVVIESNVLNSESVWKFLKEIHNFKA